MTQITIPIKVNSPSHNWLTVGVERFGTNYRHKWKGQYYKVVGCQPSVKGEFKLILEPIL